jgi:hypothetical protein
MVSFGTYWWSYSSTIGLERISLYVNKMKSVAINDKDIVSGITVV